MNANESGPATEPRPGDLLLFTHARGLNRLITWFTRSRFYHVGIYQGEAHVVEARPRGVVRRDLRGGEGEAYFAVIPAPEGKGMEALRWAEAHIGASYDVANVLVLVLDRCLECVNLRYSSGNRFACGELVVRAYRAAGVNLFPHCAPESVVPAHFESMLPAGAKIESFPPNQTRPTVVPSKLAS